VEGTCTIWKAGCGEWRGHCYPYVRVRSLNWEAIGERAALHDCLEKLWKQHCKLKGLVYPRDCPHAELIQSRVSVRDDAGLYQLVKTRD